MILVKKEILERIKKQDLITDFINLEKQLTPNGFDLTVATISQFNGAGSLDFSNKQRCIPSAQTMQPIKADQSQPYGWWELAAGSYKVKTNESVNLSSNIIALAFSRTSLLRMGAFTEHGVWDAGFSGRGEFILNVTNNAGIRIKQNARLAQLIFYEVAETESYNGIFKQKR
jgi:dUTP pyrophosphatase